ncbi:MAG: glycosyltransferase family 39 protein [Filifactoraceae bacterium]
MIRARKFLGYTGYTLTIAFFLMVIIYGAFINGTVSFETPWQTLVLSMGSFALLFFILKLLIDRFKLIHSNLTFSVFIGVIATLPRVIWVYFVRTVPEIDFLRFHEYTKALIVGDYKAYLKIRTVFPHITGFPLIQSFYYRIFGDSVWSGISFNIVCTVATAIILYFLVSEISNRSSGRLAALLFALWPNQIMFSGLIASEPLFTLFFVLSFLFFYKGIKNIESKRLTIYSVLLGLSLAVSQIVRPISSTFVPTLVLFLFLYNVKFKNSRVYLVRSMVLLVLVITSFSLGVFGFNVAFSDETLVPLGTVKSGMSLFAGTSKDSNGMWNPEVTKILESTGYDYNASHEEGKRRGLENIKNDPSGFLELVVSKFATQWAMDDFGLYWSMVNTNPDTEFTLWVKSSWDNREKLYIISQSYYLAVIFWGMIYSVYLLGKRSLRCNEGTAVIMIVGFTLLHCFTEVQSRYHYSLMPFFIIMAVAGINVIGRRTHHEDTV